VGVADEDVDRERLRAELAQQLMAELTDPRPCVKDKDMVIRPDFDARRVAAVAERGWAGCRD